jgi:hypothetical protein
LRKEYKQATESKGNKEMEHRTIVKNNEGTWKGMKCNKKGRDKEWKEKRPRGKKIKEKWLTKKRLPWGEVAGSELQVV